LIFSTLPRLDSLSIAHLPPWDSSRNVKMQVFQPASPPSRRACSHHCLTAVLTALHGRDSDFSTLSGAPLRIVTGPELVHCWGCAAAGEQRNPIGVGKGWILLRQPSKDGHNTKKMRWLWSRQEAVFSPHSIDDISRHPLTLKSPMMPSGEIFVRRSERGSVSLQ